MQFGKTESRYYNNKCKQYKIASENNVRQIKSINEIDNMIYKKSIN